MSITQTSTVIRNSNHEPQLAKDARDAITEFANGDAELRVTFARSSGERLEIPIPASALKIFANLLGDLATGKSPDTNPHPVELTTHQAAELLRVSRPFLIKLLDQGIIEHRKVGRHRRVAYEDLKAYMDKEKIARRETLAELAAYDQEIGLDNFDME